MENQTEYKKEEILKKVIKVSKIEGITRNADGVLIGKNIFDDKGVKHAMWFTKKDGTDTKACEQFRSQGIDIGSEIGIAYTEQPNNFQYKDKTTGETKQATSTNRKIVWFSEPSDIETYSRAGEPQEPTGEQPPISLYGDEQKEKEEIDVSKIPF